MATARAARRVAPPLEHRILVTATLCLLAFGAVMVYSASSPGALETGGYGTGEFVTYLMAAAIGLVAMRICEHRGLQLLNEKVLRLLLGFSFFLLLVVMVPGIGVSVNGARRWFAAGPLQFQPSELMKLALVLYCARYLADHPRRAHLGFKQAVMPLVVVVGPACVLIAVEPDLGTTLVVAFSFVAMLAASGMPGRYIGGLAAIAVVLVCFYIGANGYERARLTSFLHPWSTSCKADQCYQTDQGQIALGSGGLFGVGIGNSIEKDSYLPEAQTDFILGVVGEELGVVGVLGVLFLYGMIGYAGLRTARRAATRYTKLLASGLTSLILCQGLLNIFVVLGLAPLTGVPLPFISYAPTNLIVMLVSVGLLMGIARPAARELRLVDQRPKRAQTAAGREYADDSDRSRRNSGARRAGAGRR
jgi:cell division protein FtsW